MLLFSNTQSIIKFPPTPQKTVFLLWVYWNQEPNRIHSLRLVFPSPESLPNEQTRNRKNSTNLIRSPSKKPAANNILNGDTCKPFPLKSGRRQRCSFSVLESSSVLLRLNNSKGRNLFQIVEPIKKFSRLLS